MNICLIFTGSTGNPLVVFSRGILTRAGHPPHHFLWQITPSSCLSAFLLIYVASFLLLILPNPFFLQPYLCPFKDISSSDYHHHHNHISTAPCSCNHISSSSNGSSGDDDVGTGTFLALDCDEVQEKTLESSSKQNAQQADDDNRIPKQVVNDGVVDGGDDDDKKMPKQALQSSLVTTSG